MDRRDVIQFALWAVTAAAFAGPLRAPEGAAGKAEKTTRQQAQIQELRRHYGPQDLR